MLVSFSGHVHMVRAAFALMTLSLGCSTDTGPLTAQGGVGAGAGTAGSAGLGGAGGGSAPGKGGTDAGVAGTAALGATAGGGSGGGAASPGAAGASGRSGAGGEAGSADAGGGGRGGAPGAGGAGAGAASGGAGASAGTAGLGAGGDDGLPPDEEIPPGYVKGIIGVGYGGIRILSRDGGSTWGERVSIAASGGDDDNLIRAIAYGKGRWIATGWNLWTSDDGLAWTSHGKLHDGFISDQQIIEGLAYASGYFYAAGDGSPSRLYRSADGLSWERYAQIGDTVKHTGLKIRDGVFVSFGDSHTSYQSSDGLSWTAMGIDDATFCEGTWKSLADCHDAAWFDDGFYLTVEWGGEIRRSTSGQNFQTVYRDDEENTLYKSCAVAEGYVAAL